MPIVKRQSMSQKLIIIFLYTSFIILVAHFITYMNMNHALNKLDYVYASNSNLAELEECINETQSSMYHYLNLKSSTALESYYESIQNLESKLLEYNDQVTDSKNLMMESHIKRMAKKYIQKTSEAVQAKRGRNIRKYNESYNEAIELAEYMHAYIASLNSIQFKANSSNYLILRHSLNSLEGISTIILVGIIGLNAVMLFFISRQVTRPLIKLSRTANEIATGDFGIDLIDLQTGDEVEVLSKAFNKMIISIREYIEKLRKSMIVESEMKENELKMENYLKDAKLKYLQAQINPHFLFNTLNAGMQLAMMEEAEQTSIFIENMAEFFRYSISKMDHETTLEEELKLVDHYIYILNVRFCGEICYEKEIDERFMCVKVPSMIIQPIVENVFQYGIRDIEWEGKINLRVYQKAQVIHIEVQDNGKGMMHEQIDEILKGEFKAQEDSKISNGIGLGNVMSRLRLYYGIEQVMDIQSEGINKGTKVILRIPLDQRFRGDENDV